MKPVDLHYGGTSDTGLVRHTNQDGFLVAPPVFVVADGMGGHEGGEIASRIVVEEFARVVDEGYDIHAGSKVVTATLDACQQRIRDYAASRNVAADEWHSGTTAVVALLVEDDGSPKWLLANLGDSRIYRVTEGALEQVSVDHSVVQELLDAGEIDASEAATHPERHVITRALGAPEGVEADFWLLPLSSVERLLLCSDGITGMIDDAEIEKILGHAEDPRDAADALVAAALAAGGRDNATAVVVDVVGLVSNPDYDAERQRVSLEQKLGALP